MLIEAEGNIRGYNDRWLKNKRERERGREGERERDFPGEKEQLLLMIFRYNAVFWYPLPSENLVCARAVFTAYSVYQCDYAKQTLEENNSFYISCVGYFRIMDIP